jgi:hypothetical protein
MTKRAEKDRDGLHRNFDRLTSCERNWWPGNPSYRLCERICSFLKSKCKPGVLTVPPRLWFRHEPKPAHWQIGALGGRSDTSRKDIHAQH